MIYNITSLPSIFHVEPGAIAEIGDIIDSHGIASNRALVLTGKSKSLQYARRVREQLHTATDCMVLDHYSEGEVARVGRVIDQARATLLVAVGGGGVIDVAKRAGKLFSVPVLVIPTVVSNDGLMSPISVLKVDATRSDSLPAAMPLGVIVDLDIIMAAPDLYLQASGGDLLSNLSATSDWRIMTSRGEGPKINDAAFHLARNAAETLVFSSDPDLRNPRFVRCLVVAQIYSGIAMTLSGNSRPCSGPEHLFSHALDELGLTPEVLHGVQVGSVCFFMLDLLGELTPEVVRFGEAMQLPTVWTRLSKDIEPRLMDVIRHVRTVRPGRRTFLDDMSDEEIRDKALAFARARE